MRKVLASVLLMVMPAASAAACPDLVDGPAAEVADRYLDALVPFGFDGGLIVVRDGRTILQAGYGSADESRERANDGCGLFDIQSVTKVLTALAVEALVDSGDLTLDGTIDRYLDGVPDDKASITIEQLLRHRSGIVSGTEDHFEPSDRDGILRVAMETPLAFAPGEGRMYSNIGYSLLAMIVEAVTETPFDQALERLVLTPAGADDTGYLTDRSDGRLVIDYDASGAADKPLARGWGDWNFVGAAGVYTTLQDLATLARWDIEGDGAPPSASWSSDDTEYGTVYSADGGTSHGGATSVRHYMDQDLTIVLYGNRDGERWLFADGLVDRVDRALLGPPPSMPPPVAAISEHAPEERRALVGRYTDGSGGELIIDSDGRTLTVSGSGQAVVDALLGPVAGASKREAQVAQALASLSRGDGSALQSLFRKPSSSELIDAITARTRDLKATPDERVTYRVLGSAPDWMIPGDGSMTVIRASAGLGSTTFRLHWSGDVIIALGGSGLAAPAVMIGQLAQRAVQLHHIATGRNAALRTDPEDPAALILSVPGGSDIRLRRTR